MKANRAKNKIIFIVIMGLVCALLLVAQLVSGWYFNNQKHQSVGLAQEEDIYADMHYRGDSTSSWEKIDLGIWGNIYDIEVFNNSSVLLKDWSITVNIQNDCYINQFWNGQVEIHQYVGTDKETVQKLSLADYELEDLELDYIMDGADLLIPLKKGDSVIYYPTDNFQEKPIPPGNSVTVGGIFYYKDEIDLTNYTMDYYCYRDITKGVLFFIFVVLAVAWLFVVGIYLVARYVYRKTKKENELRMSGISCLSELYEVVYIVDLQTDTVMLVGNDLTKDKDRPKDMPAHEQFEHLFRVDPKEEYLELTQEFADLSTIAGRLATKNSIVFEYESKKYGWNRIQFIAMERNNHDMVTKVLFTVQQINEEKEQINRVLSQVEKANSESNAKSAFLANMSHEIRTPINTILGLDTMILRECSENSVRAYARDIKVAGNMLLALINGILDYSKLEAGKMELVEGEYSLKKMIYEAECVVKTRIRSKNLEFRIDVSENLPDHLYGDDVRLKQVIINLLTNALKYTESGGIRMAVYGKMTQEDKVHLLFSVKDSGSGITPENQKKLFERFSRFDSKKNRNVEGTGIGMNLVQGLLDLMGSQLKVASVYGKGSDFYFEVEQKVIDSTPVGKVNWDTVNTELIGEDEKSSFKAPKARILVVDDNDMNLIVFANLLKETQMQIDKETSGAAALELTKKKEYDLIFMDHMMPEMDGIEAFHAIREQVDGKNKNTPVIILTANAMQGAKEQYLQEGFNDFLAKPIEESKLEEKIVQILSPELIEEASTANTEKNEITMPEIEGVDVGYALEHSGGIDGALRIMERFEQLAMSDAEELKQYYDELREDPDNYDALTHYRIKVHAMKTSAALCGAIQLHGAAAQLEYAARDKKVQQILETTNYFLEFWEKVYLSFKEYFEKTRNVDVKEGSIHEEALVSLLKQLITSMNAYDIKGADSIVKELDSYQDDEALQEVMEEIKVSVANLDAEGCETICRKMIGD
ncbi:hybrid sensor histidine kinase/response regulator [Eubacterium oxidoreducens]|uniref:Circadian input-output histidine kinase CikA n=1 Tax=Eubacterium oxidoreducens TaxID=1732 RepID=A0A1G6AF35_EUBOX|nr:hybrid sensor histidine kinase/response regulator [Eubacterium oxidoreducens]SDB06916.1 Signal transduction histidine kinase [Eubacterium oxidoreducens]